MGKALRRLGRSTMALAGTCAVAGICIGTARASLPADPTGIWLVENGDARIRIEHCQKPHDKICGYLVWSKDAASGKHGTDEKNPDVTRRSRPLLGMQILLGLAADDDMYVGEIYDAENGKTYDAKIRREGTSRLTLKGCVLRYLCQSQTWTKVDDVAAGQLTGPTGTADGPKPNTEYAQSVALGSRKPKH